MSDVKNNFIKFISSNAGRLSEITLKYPSFLILCGVLSGIIPVLNNNYIWILYAIIPGAFSFYIGRGAFLRFLTGLIIGTGTALFNLSVPENNYSVEIGRAHCGAEVKVEVIDSSCAGPEVDWLPNPGLLICRVRQMRYSGYDDWRPVSGRLAVKLPDDFRQIIYGDQLLLKGIFVLPDDNSIKETYNIINGQAVLEQKAKLSGFSFNNYLRAKRIYRCFYAKEATVAGHENSFMGGVLHFRNLIMKKLCDGIKSDDSKRLLSALVFGCKQGLEWETRQEFIKTGTIHIFTVSGFHVGILALLVFWILRRVPFRIRYFIVPGVVFFYVLTTGMHPPAVRTLIMITVWSCCRGMLYRTPGLNIIFGAASIILVYNPFYISDIGFQYSFVVVAFLVASINPIRQWASLAGEHLQWIPGEYKPAVKIKIYRLAQLTFTALAGCLIAWIASSGITLFYQGFYFPQAVPLNFLIIPFVWMIFLMSALKLLLMPLTIFTVPLGVLLEWLINGMSGFCEFFYNNFNIVSLIAPGWLGLILFYIALLLLIVAASPRVFVLASALLAVVIIFWHSKGELSPSRLNILYGGGEAVPSLLIVSQGNIMPVVINVPDKFVARNIANSLRERGINRIEKVIISESTKKFLGGLPYLMTAVKINEIVIPEGRGKYFTSTLNAAVSDGIKATVVKNKKRPFYYKKCFLKVLNTNNTLTVDYNYGMLNIKTKQLDRKNGSCGVSFYTNHSKYCFNIERTNNHTIREYLFR